MPMRQRCLITVSCDGQRQTAADRPQQPRARCRRRTIPARQDDGARRPPMIVRFASAGTNRRATAAPTWPGQHARTAISMSQRRAATDGCSPASRTMMTLYFLVKYLHVLGAIVILGTGTGIAFFMLMAHLSGQAAFIARTAGVV